MEFREAISIVEGQNYKDASDYIQINNGCPQELPDDFELIDAGLLPRFPKWKKNLITKFDSHGLKRIWQIGFDGDSMWILHGTLTSTKIDVRKVETNSSGRTLVEQALLETAELYKRKIQKGNYSPNINEVKPTVSAMRGYDLEENSNINWERGMIADTKLDGLRLLCFFNGKDLDLRSNGNESYNHLTHIKEEMLEFAYYLPPDTFIDGELYNPEMDLEDINSAVRTYKRFNPESLKISYYIFDIDTPARPCVEDRYEILINAYNMFLCNQLKNGLEVNYIKIVHKWFVYSYQQAIQCRDEAISNGYEGIILRHPGKNATTEREKELSRYKYGGKTVALYKVKKFITEEGPIVDVTPGKGRDSKLGILNIRDQKTGYVLKIKWGKNPERKEWLMNPSSVIGKILIFKYARRNKKTNIPLQPSGVGFRPFYN